MELTGTLKLNEAGHFEIITDRPEPRLQREFQKTCGCKTFAVSEFDLDSAKGKVQTKK